ncbi:MAG: YncE family protein [Bacteroidales bacterium]|nr:YncE family protein [Bacteroidales bacterium]
MSLVSCMKDDELWVNTKPIIKTPFKGLYIVNEGNYMYGNASLSYYDIESKEVHNDVFFETNSLLLGDVAQSMVIHNGLAYIVINNSGKIYVIDSDTFEYRGKITGLVSPRYIHFISDDKAYVTDLYGKSISIINPQSLEIIGSIDVSVNDNQFYRHSTDQMVQYDKYVFTNCWSYDNQILVIDSETDKLIDSIEVQEQPTSLVLDKFGKIWTITDGGYSSNGTSSTAALIKIDAKTREVERIIYFKNTDHPTELKINGAGDRLYFLNGDVYSMDVVTGMEPEIFIESQYQTVIGGYYGLAVDPITNEVYVADAIDFVQRGVVYRFTDNAQPVDTFKVGIVPGDFCFKTGY